MSTSLPNTYQRVYYIQSSGTQYINTGVTLNEDIFCELDFSLTENTSSETDIFGADISPYPVIGTLNSKFRFRVTSAFLSDTVSVDTDRHKLFWSSTKITLDGLTLVSGSAGAYSISYNAYLFAANTSSGANYFSKVRIYSCRIHNKDTGKVIRNFLPCYRKSDGVIGMYDLINDIFYTNNGSGTFTKGNNLNNLTYKNFKLFLGRKTETHENWESHTVNNYGFTYEVWQSEIYMSQQVKHYKRKLLGSSDSVKDVVITSYSISDARGRAIKTRNCQVVTSGGNTYIEISFTNSSSSDPIGYFTTASYTYSTKESTTVYIPEIYKNVILGGQIFNIKSDIDIVPILGPSIDAISLSYSAGFSSISVKATNSSNYDIEINLARTIIDTSSATYYDDDFYNEGHITSPLPAGETNYEIAYFNDGCELYRAYISFEFVYNGTVLGSLSISYEE